jgi:uncharacterized protein (DUF342 family)
MMTFKQYLFESAFKHTKNHGRDVWWHWHDMNGKKVEVAIGKNPNDEHHDVSFHVDYNATRHGDSDIHNTNILHHVHGVIKQFVREKQPKTLRFAATDTNTNVQTQKQQMYHKYAEHLSKRLGGNARMERDGSSYVDLP